MRPWFRAALLSAVIALAAPAAAGPALDFAAAVAAPGRPDSQRALDASRRPAEVLAFLGLEQGMTAADIMAGTGYYTEILARAVGPKGKVIAYEPSQFLTQPRNVAVFDGLAFRYPNLSMAPYPFEAFSAPADSLDFVLLHLVYHDLYWQSDEYKVPRSDPAAFLRAVFAATKPGGIVGVVDHVAAPGDTRETVDKLHRIDPATLRADFAAAGFVLEAESALLRVPADDHAKSVFDPAVRHRTDRLLYRYRKPR